MNHNQLKELVYSLFDGELDPANQQEAKKHWESCEECRDEVKDWEKISHLLFQETTLQENPYFAQKVMRALEDENPPSPARSLWDWLIPSLGFGVAAVLLFLSFFPTSEIISADDFLTANGAAAESVSVEDFIDYDGGGEL